MNIGSRTANLSTFYLQFRECDAQTSIQDATNNRPIGEGENDHKMSLFLEEKQRKPPPAEPIARLKPPLRDRETLSTLGKRSTEANCIDDTGLLGNKFDCPYTTAYHQS